MLRVPAFSIFCVFFLHSYPLPAQDLKLPPKEDVLKKTKIANDYFMKKWPNACTDCLTGNRPSNIWTRAVYFEGNLAYYEISKDKDALDYAVSWATFHQWNFRGGSSTNNADNQCAGQIYLDLYRIDTKPERIANTKVSIDKMVTNSANNHWTWIDAIQMAMPIFAKLGVLYPSSSSSYFNKMYKFYDYPKATLKLYNKDDGLWWRDVNFINRKSPSGKNVYWSRGNGWVFAALVRVLSEIPANETHRKEYETTFKEMAEAIKAVQRFDGFWNENLADSTHYGGPEVTGTGLFTYGMAWGIRNGLLESEIYLPTIIKAWNAIADSAIFSSGALGYVQGTGDSPGDNGSGFSNVTPSRSIVPDFDDYGLGCVLLAGSEVFKLTEYRTGTPLKKQYINQNSLKTSTLQPLFGTHLILQKPVSGRYSSITAFDLKGRVLAKIRPDKSKLIHYRIGSADNLILIKTAYEPENANYRK